MTYAVLANGLFVERGGKELMRLDELALNAGEVLAVVGPMVRANPHCCGPSQENGVALASCCCGANR